MNKLVFIRTIGTSYILSNYGSFLQHWALRTVLKRMGFESKRYSDANDRYYLLQSTSTKGRIKESIRIILHYLGVKKYQNNVFSFRRLISFIKFRREYEALIGPLIEKIEHGYCAILGGDQIIYPHDIETALQLECNKHIIYSGSSNWNANNNNDVWTRCMETLIPRYDAVSVREIKGVEILTQITHNKKIYHVADPVILVDKIELSKLYGEKVYFKKPTVFGYFVNIDNINMLPLNDLLQLANLNKTELSISGIQGADAVIPHKFYKCPSPHNFVRAIKDAKLFVTNSYHGTLLAIMLHTPFITIAQEGITASQNTRQEELLTWLNLREHMIKSNELCDMGVSIFNQKVNWGYVDKLLVQYRQESLNWLEDILNK